MEKGESGIQSRRAFTLMEIVVCIALIAISVLIILGLIPMGAVSLQKAQDVQAATLYGTELLEDGARPDYVPPSPDRVDRDFEVTLNHTTYHVQRAIYACDASHPPRLYDVVVTVAWSAQPQPVSLRTRVYHP